MDKSFFGFYSTSVVIPSQRIRITGCCVVDDNLVSAASAAERFGQMNQPIQKRVIIDRYGCGAGTCAEGPSAMSQNVYCEAMKSNWRTAIGPSARQANSTSQLRDDKQACKEYLTSFVHVLKSPWLLMPPKSFALLIGILLLFTPGKAQPTLPDYLGISGGLTCTFGTIINRVGVEFRGYYLRDFAQINVQLRGHYNFSSFGPRPRIPGWEFQGIAGAVLGFGPHREEELNPFLGPLNHQTDRQYAVGYAYHCYFDQMETSQLGGSAVLHIGRFQIATENDALSGLIEDRFRTGAVLINYRLEDTQIGLSSVMWTGDTRSKGTFKVRESDYPGRFGYKDISAGVYGRFSHGIAAIQVQRNLGFGQIAQVQMGVDSEWVRHVIQNKLIHDMWFVPLEITKVRNLHLPMLDEDGMPYLFRKDQRVKPASFFFTGSLNPSLFY